MTNNNTKTLKFMKKKYYLAHFFSKTGLKKLLLIMRLSIVLNLICTVAFSANSFSQSQNFSMNLENAKVKDVFHSIEGQSTYRFFYNDELTDINRMVSMNVKDSKIEDVLNQLFSNTDITYTILENNLIVIAPKRAIQPQKITGTVVDAESNQPLPGVSIQMEGTTNGVITDIEGKYSIDAPQNSVLVFSFVGYLSEKVTVSGQSNIDVKLVSDIKRLDEIVVVGYGTQKKSDVTGATVHVNEEDLRSVPVANLQNALQGKAAGLEMQRTGSNPGSGTQIRIRGIKSILGSNDPLIVLDGIPFDAAGNLNDINPDDIATVDVLKDASSTAIYGSRGSNGVILITSKKGQNDGVKVSYNGYYGVSNVANYFPVFSPGQYIAYRNYSQWNQGYQPEELISMATGRTTNWQKLMYQQASKQDHNVSVSGGHDGNSYTLGAGYYNETAVVPGQDYTRYSLRAAIDGKIGKRTKVGLSSLNSIGVTDGSQFVMQGTMFFTVVNSPLMPAYNPDGTVRVFPNGNPNDNSAQYSPLLLKSNNNKFVDKVRRYRTLNSLYGEYQIIDGLKYRINLGLSFWQQENDQFRGADIGWQQSQNNPSDPSFFRYHQGNTASVDNINYWSATIENLLIYDKTFAKKHHVTFTGLYSEQEDHQRNTSISKDSITQDFTQFYALGLSSSTAPYTLGGGETSSAILSYMGRLNYNYNDRYMLTVTGRSDGSSKLAVGHKWHQFASASAGWNITSEEFMKRIRPISYLKLRAGFGQVANQSITPYSSLGSVSNNNGISLAGLPGSQITYNYGSQIVSGYQLTSLPNPNLDWEYTKTYNAGLDFGVLANRITGSFELYLQKTYNLLASITLPQTSGITGPFLENVGNVTNKGLELTLTTRNIAAKSGFQWTTDFNLFLNRNRLDALNAGFTQNIQNQLFIGQSLTSIYDYKKLGIWQLNEADQASIYGAVPGQLKLKDLNGDGRIDATNDKGILGNQDANAQGGMTNRFSFKGFDFSFVLYARFGGLLVSQMHQPLSGYLTIMDGNRNQLKVDYWTPSNPTNWFPSPGNATVSPQADAQSTLGYYDGTFVKIRSINFGYTFSPTLLKKVNIKTLKLYVTVDNVATLFSPFMKQTGIDPETNAVGNTGIGTPANIRQNGNGNGALVVGLTTPLTRTFSVGANLSF